MRIRPAPPQIAQSLVGDLLVQIELGHALHGAEVSVQRLPLDVVGVHDARPVQGDLEPLLGRGDRGGGREGERRGGRGAGGAATGGGGGGAVEQLARARHLADVDRSCGREVRVRVRGDGVQVARVVRQARLALEREGQRTRIEGLLGGVGAAVDGQRHVVGRVVVLVSEAVVRVELAEALQQPEHLAALGQVGGPRHDAQVDGALWQVGGRGGSAADGHGGGCR